VIKVHARLNRKTHKWFTSVRKEKKQTPSEALREAIGLYKGGNMNDFKTRVMISMSAVLILVLVGEFVGLITGIYPSDFTWQRVFLDIMMSMGLILGLMMTASVLFGVPLIIWLYYKK